MQCMKYCTATHTYNILSKKKTSKEGRMELLIFFVSLINRPVLVLISGLFYAYFFSPSDDYVRNARRVKWRQDEQNAFLIFIMSWFKYYVDCNWLVGVRFHFVILSTVMIFGWLLWIQYSFWLLSVRFIQFIDL